jgi:hypothetical protein
VYTSSVLSSFSNFLLSINSKKHIDNNYFKILQLHVRLPTYIYIYITHGCSLVHHCTQPVPCVVWSNRAHPTQTRPSCPRSMHCGTRHRPPHPRVPVPTWVHCRDDATPRSHWRLCSARRFCWEWVIPR